MRGGVNLEKFFQVMTISIIQSQPLLGVPTVSLGTAD